MNSGSMRLGFSIASVRPRPGSRSSASAPVSLALRSGEIWVFRQDGAAAMTLERSIYLEKSRLRPRETVQIVLTQRALDFETQVGWTLAKAQDTPLAIRDLEREDPASQI